MSLSDLLSLVDVVMTNAKAHLALVYMASALTTFSLSFVKTLQTRNIVLGHYWAAFITSWCITTLEVASIGFVVIGGWWVILSAGFGGSVGIVLAMRIHERLFKKH